MCYKSQVHIPLMNNMKIAVLGTRGLPNVQGGVEKHCEELYPRLSALGCQVTVFARKGYVDAGVRLWKGVKIHPLWTLRRKSLEAIIHTFAGIMIIAFGGEKYDIVHIHAIGPALLVPLARMLGLKVVMTNHGPDYNRQKWGRAAKVALRLGETFGTRLASAVIAVSRPIQRSLEEQYGRVSFYIPNGIAIHENIPPGRALARYGLREKRYVLGVGRLVPEKGFHDLVNAFTGISSDWNLVIAGDADHEDDYSRSLKRLASGNPKIVMTGFINGDTLKEIFSNAGLFVLPSYHEGLPIVLLEAMSYGVRCLVSDIPANLELISDAGFVFPPGDTISLSAKLRHYLSAPADEDAALRNRQRMEEEFNWDRTAREVLHAYEAVRGDMQSG
jgi:glycosyltransferase involved in cell wall biosynthesis